MNKLFNNKHLIIYILLFGFILRLAFILFGAEIYFNRENIYIDGDTGAWRVAFMNLIEHGIFSVNLQHEYGFFGRLPGYSFFIGIFYFLSGQNWDLAYRLIAWVQILLDIFSILLVYKISLKIFTNIKIANIASLLYAFYPFIIVWNPVVYSDFMGVFFMILCLYFFVYTDIKFNYFLSGIFLSLAILNRPQIILLAPVFFIYLLIENVHSPKFFIKKSFFLGLALLLIYGAWPIRNYVNYKKIILTQEVKAFRNYDIDLVAYRQYVYSVKTEMEPQFSYLLNNQKVIFPKQAYINKEDSIKLERAIYLCKNCGSSFSYWHGHFHDYWKEPITGENCNEEIAQLFNELRKNQIKNNPLNFYLILPLKNLKKAIFKSQLYDTSTRARKLASLLFFYRTILILLGLFGIILMFKHKVKGGLIFLLFFLSLYIALCFGTGVNFRSIEIRSFLPADILLLFPVSFTIFLCARKVQNLLFR